MPRAATALELVITLDRVEGKLHRQLEGQLRGAVRSGALRHGLRLPSSRMLAAQLGISRGVVVEAYNQLVAEGYLTAIPRAGVHVAAGAGSATASAKLVRQVSRPQYDLQPGLPALELFPRTTWAASMRRVLREVGDAELGYPAAAGHPRLRHELATYLSRVRGVVATPDQLVITQGVTQGIALACIALRSRGVERMALEDPSHRDEREIVARAGMSIVPVPVDDHGIDVTALRRTGAQAVLLTPVHQFPTGVLLSPERRAELLNWLGSGDRYVVEDDYDAELRYGGSPIGALQGLRPARVIYVSSASKSLIPALRLGWLLLPSEFVAEVAEHKRYADLGSPSLDQLAFADFLARGEFDRHLRRLRVPYRRRRSALVEALEEHLPDANLLGIPAGLHLAVELPGRDEDDLCRRALNASVNVTGLATHLIKARRPATLLIGFASNRPDVLREAVAQLAATM